MYGFLPARGMGYGVLEAMGYGLNFPANQLGGWDFLWGITGYGVSHIWVIAGSTVDHNKENIKITGSRLIAIRRQAATATKKEISGVSQKTESINRIRIQLRSGPLCMMLCRDPFKEI